MNYLNYARIAKYAYHDTIRMHGYKHHFIQNKGTECHVMTRSDNQPMVFDRALISEETTIFYNQNLPKDYADIPTSITDDCVFALEMTSNDNSLTDLSINTNNGTAVGGVTSDGAEIDWDDTSTNVESSSSSSST